MVFMAPLFPHKFLGIGGEEDCNLYGREGISRVFLLLFGYDTCFSDVCSISNINSCLDMMSGHQFKDMQVNQRDPDALFSKT